MRRGPHAVLVAVSLVLTAGAANAAEWNLSGLVAAEARIFPRDPAFANQEDGIVSPSIVFQPELRLEWNGGDDRVTAVPFLRLDADDEERTHADIRELNWLHFADDWDLRVGIGKVFWGVAESRHLVNIVNQTDAVEDTDEEDKLGQPMVNLNLLRDWGTVGVFVLPGFRKRTFPGRDARLRGAFSVDVDNPVFESGAKERHVDFALRWSHTFGNWDVGLSHFRGTGREPRLVKESRNGETVLVPHYDQIDQTGLDAQYTSGAWLWKLEAMTRHGQGDRFAALVGGFEYTFFGVAGTVADLGILGEYLYDGRDATAPATAADGDVFVGARLSLNDEQSTELLAGAMVDHGDGTTAFFIEAQRRIGDRWKIEAELRATANVATADPSFGVRRDDVLQITLSRFF